MHDVKKELSHDNIGFIKRVKADTETMWNFARMSGQEKEENKMFNFQLLSKRVSKSDKIETYGLIFMTVGGYVLRTMKKKRAIKTKGNCKLR